MAWLIPGIAHAQDVQAALEAAVARGLVDAQVAEALEARGRVRILAAFHTPRGVGGIDVSKRANAARARLIGEGLRPGRRFSHLPGLAGSVDARALALLCEDPDLERVSLEAPVQGQLAEAVPLVKLDTLHGLGATGSGATVVIVDTGVDLVHPDLAGAVIAEQCFCDDGLPGSGGCCPDGSHEQSGPGAGQDDHGHGTRVAGIVTSAGVHAPLGGAPDAQLIALKVLSAAGSGMGTDVLAGLDWVLVNHADVEVVNLSLGSGLYTGQCDTADAFTILMASAVDQLRASGVLSVAGAGNNGSGTQMIVPACLSNALSVGAVWDADVGSRTQFGCTDATTAADQVTCWSNSNETTDVFAPGGRITSSLLGSTQATRNGTSYATPLVSACAAVLSRLHPGAGVDEIAGALVISSVQVVDATNGLAFPRLDCAAAHASLAPAVPSIRGAAVVVLALALGGAAVVVWSRRRTRDASASSI